MTHVVKGMLISVSVFLLLVLSCSGGESEIGSESYIDRPWIVNVPVESRSITFENPTGEKGGGGKAASNLGVGRKGSPLREVRPGETVVLCDIKGPGVIRHIWMTVRSTPENLLGFVIRGYWDGQKHPSIEAPIGNFFGCGHGVSAAYQSAVHSVNSSAGLSIYLPMPFREKAYFTITNEGPGGADHVYYQIDYTMGETLPDDFGRLHVQYRRENPTTLKEDFEILPKRTGSGRYIGCIMGARIVDPEWWGEGEVKIYLDGDEQFPTICGTGTEDYIGQSWGLQRTSYLYSGTPLWEDDLFTMYRWHLKDPVYWKKDIRVTIQQIGASAKRGYFDRQDDWSVATFWYEAKPSAPLEPLIAYAKRIEDLIDEPSEPHRPKQPDVVTAGEFKRIYDPSAGEAEKWYINDHCFIADQAGGWHLFGITHQEPASPSEEDNLAHATADSLGQQQWVKKAFALSVDEQWGEKHLWAPYVVF